MRTTITAALLAASALVAGCYRGTDNVAQQDGGGTEASGAGETPATSNGSDDGEAPPGVCADASLGVTPLRRLGAVEYRNSVADLFQITPPPVESLPSDAKFFDFRTTSNQMLSAGTATKYFDAAALVATARDLAAPTWFPCEEDGDCVDDYLRDEGRRIFRRPLSDDEIAHYHGLFSGRIAAGDSAAEAASILLQALLVSPHFLFLEQPTGEPGERVVLDDWQIAARLSYLVWASTPDDTLLDAAAAGGLASADARAEQAQRLLEDPRAKLAADSFFMQWFTTEDISSVVKDPVAYPQVVPELTAALEEESRLYFREVFWNRGAALDELLVSPIRVRNATLSAFYGDSLADSSELTVLDGDVDEHSFGLLSQAGLLMSVSRNAPTQIIYRGKFIRNKLLCQHITPPMAGTVPPLPEIDPLATTREQVAQHTAAPACAGCHRLLNPPGFALEHFDNIGVWRDQERELTIDATADLTDLGIDAPIDGALALSQALAASEAVQSCAVAQMFEFAIGREPASEDACITDDLFAAFVESGGDLQSLLIDIVASEAFAERVAPQE
jgi:Protein of unknown function (DUF1592)/Protein of unknown function (DUF1588)/Protein of unknown function (DUF1595)/Protein of unknown function (DUF1585)/Protein of unknown function (DUF1587)